MCFTYKYNIDRIANINEELPLELGSGSGSDLGSGSGSDAGSGEDPKKKNIMVN